jgi:hypothetical protein
MQTVTLSFIEQTEQVVVNESWKWYTPWETPVKTIKVDTLRILSEETNDVEKTRQKFKDFVDLYTKLNPDVSTNLKYLQIELGNAPTKYIPTNSSNS